MVRKFPLTDISSSDLGDCVDLDLIEKCVEMSTFDHFLGKSLTFWCLI